MREKRTTREHFAPASKEGARIGSYINIDPAQVDRFEFRYHTSKEGPEEAFEEEEELEMA